MGRLLLAFCLPAFFCSTFCSAIAENLRIVVLGDSITKGVRTGVLPEQTFASLLQSELRESGLEVDVVNQGIGGERTDQALNRLARDIIEAKPQVVTVMYGTNDSYVDKGQQNSRLTAEQYGENLKEIVRQLRQAGIQPVLMTEPRWGKAASPNGAGEHPNLRLEAFVVVCRNVAKELQVPLVDHFQIWTDAEKAGTDIGAWTTDQCHPNPEGHQILSKAMVKTVRSELTKRNTRE